ncbi:hypothetical protein Tco_0964871 [Tanacetum coccineum]
MHAPRKGLTTAAIKRLVNQHVAEALAKQEANRNNGSGRVNGNVNVNGDRNANARGGTDRAVGLARWFEKMESVFHISNCSTNCQVKFDAYTLQGYALTWWNSHKRTIGVEAAYVMTWNELMRLMTERFQELDLLCPKMVPNEEEKIRRYIFGLPDNFQGNLTSFAPTRLQDAIMIFLGKGLPR